MAAIMYVAAMMNPDVDAKVKSGIYTVSDKDVTFINPAVIETYSRLTSQEIAQRYRRLKSYSTVKEDSTIMIMQVSERAIGITRKSILTALGAQFAFDIVLQMQSSVSNPIVESSIYFESSYDWEILRKLIPNVYLKTHLRTQARTSLFENAWSEQEAIDTQNYNEAEAAANAAREEAERLAQEAANSGIHVDGENTENGG
jgi:hypothetical protein